MPEWRNWSESVVAHPTHIAKPRDAAALSALVRQARRVRVVGAGHSFMPLCETDDLLISMADYEGSLDIAPDRRTVWAPAGWSLSRLTEALWAEGLSLINQGDVNPQSLAGAAATGTHGTGAELGSIATQARGFRLMQADGDMVECGPDELPELFQAQRLSLGLFGVATEIRIDVVPAYYLEERIERWPLAEVEARLDELAASHRHAEFFIFPYSDLVMLKTLHPAAPEGALGAQNDFGDENILRLGCELATRLPAVVPTLQRLVMRTSAGKGRRIGPAYQVFPSIRTIQFEEMEYELPRAQGLPTLKEAIRHIRKTNMRIMFPFEFRLVAGDDIWMSPFNRGPGASLSIHQYRKMPWRREFAEIEQIFQANGGRPHWAKRHTLREADVHRLYPATPKFLAVREDVDPGCKFANSHLTELFGLKARAESAGHVEAAVEVDC